MQEPKIIGPYNQREQTASEAEFCEEVFELTNQQRMKYGLEPFKKMDKLSEMAAARAWENTVVFSHTRPDGRDSFTIFDENGVKYSAVAENIAAGYYTPEDVVDGWMNSSGHRANILNPAYEYLGVGFYYENGGRFWTQIFYTPLNY